MATAGYVSPRPQLHRHIRFFEGRGFTACRDSPDRAKADPRVSAGGEERSHRSRTTLWSVLRRQLADEQPGDVRRAAVWRVRREVRTGYGGSQHEARRGDYAGSAPLA